LSFLRHVALKLTSSGQHATNGTMTMTLATVTVAKPMLGFQIMSVGRTVLVLTMLGLTFCSSSATKQSEVMIAGLFNAFTYGNDGSPTIHYSQCQHLAAFMMAVDEVNNRHDGLYDDILNEVRVQMALSPGQSSLKSYPSNPYFDGTENAYQIYRNNPSVVGTVVTTSVLAHAVASSSSLNSFNSVVMLSKSLSSIFNDAHSFPMTLQIAPTTFAEATLLSDLISLKYKWRSIVIFTTTDIVGIDSYATFYTVLANFDITIIGSFFINAGVEDLTMQINGAKETGATIFVFFLDGDTAGRLLELGYDAGLFHEGTQVLATSTSNIADIRAAFTPAARENEANIMKGFMTTAPHHEYFYNTPQGQSFISRFRNLPPTIKTDPVTKSKSCNIRTVLNADGKYQYTSSMNISAFLPMTDELCLGFESFKAFNQNGSNIDPTIFYTYDAACTYLAAASGLFAAGAPVSAAALYQYMVSYPSIAPVTGFAYYIPGRGTRVVGNVLKLLNYQAAGADNGYSSEKLSFVGEHTDLTGWLLCGSEKDMASMSAVGKASCSTPLYRTAHETDSPHDAPPVIIEHLHYSFRIVLIVFSSLGLVTLVAWGVCLYMFRLTKQIKRAQPKVMACFLLGGVLGMIKVLLSTCVVSEMNCLSQLWLLHLSFRLIYRTLLLKLWRINSVINAESFKRVTISANAMLWYLAVDLLVVIVFVLIPITVISSLGPGMVGHVTSIVANQKTLYPECQVSLSLGTQVLDILLYLSDGVVLLMAIHFSVLTRGVPTSVNETLAVAPGNHN
jgi:7 transmembrane sweet-taste receptor of 3 GCPR/Receptor family ligand binding region